MASVKLPVTFPARRRTGRDAQTVADHDGARESIVDAAIELFALHGLHGMSLQMLADRVSLHKSSLFHHFTSKEEIADACLAHVIDAILPVVLPLNEDEGKDLEALVRCCEALADHFSERPAAALFLTRSIIGGKDHVPGEERPPLPQLALFFGAVARWLERARRIGTIRQIRVRHGLMNLIGLVLFYPSIAAGFGKSLLGFDPTSPRATKARRDELGALIRAGFIPANSALHKGR